MFSEISPKFIREIMPKIAATALINIKFQFNTLLRFKVIKPIRHPPDNCFVAHVPSLKET